MSDEHPFGCVCDECSAPVEPVAEVAEWDRWDAANVDTERAWAIGREDRAAEHLQRLALAWAAAEDELMVAVGMTKDAGQSWAWIADALTSVGLPAFKLNSKQAAARRFGPAVERYHALLDAAREDGEPRRQFARLARDLSARPAQCSYEVRTSKRPREGVRLSRHKLEARAVKVADRHHAYVFECDPRANVAPVLIYGGGS